MWCRFGTDIPIASDGRGKGGRLGHANALRIDLLPGSPNFAPASSMVKPRSDRTRNEDVERQDAHDGLYGRIHARTYLGLRRQNTVSPLPNVQTCRDPTFDTCSFSSLSPLGSKVNVV